LVTSVIAACVLGLVIWNPARNLSQNEFSDSIRGLLIARKNGSTIRFDHTGSDIWFGLERYRGSNKSAVLALHIPRSECTVNVGSELQRIYESNGFEFSEEDGPSLLARVLISVDDIWDKASGATGAHAGRIFLEAVGLPRSARINMTEFGEPSKRALRNRELFK
jgi:hypothetical protein